MTSSAPLRVGLLGAGRVARRYHLPILSGMENVEMAAIAEQDDEQRELCLEAAPGAATFKHFEDLFASVQLDAVVICLPPALHAEAAVASFQRGLHVYLEKPLATTREDGERVIRSWLQAGTVGWIGFNFRFHPLVIEMRDAFQQGNIGQLVTAHTCFSSAGRDLPVWKQHRKSGGGALLDLACHDFDLLGFVLGQDIVEVNALLNSRSSAEDTAEVQLRLASGQTVSDFTSLAAADQHRMEIIGTGGELRWDRYRSSRLHVNRAKRDFSKSARLRAAVSACAETPRAIGDALFPPREGSFERALAAFTGACLGLSVDGPELSAGLDSLAVILAAEQSFRSGTKVTVESGFPAP
jgi:predicted dehydrogenase